MAISLKQLKFNYRRDFCSRNKLKINTWWPKLQWEALDADVRGNCAFFYNSVPQKLVCTKKNWLSENCLRTVKLSSYNRLNNSELIGNYITAETSN